MITAQLATIPERIELLPKVINSLLPQVDILNVMLNNYPYKLRGELFNKMSSAVTWNYEDIDFNAHRLMFVDRQNQKTDGEKYYNIENYGGYIFTCDDDIEYPDTYVRDMINKIEKYNRKYVVSLHGKVWESLPIKYFFGSKGRKAAYSCLHEVVGDHVVQDENTIGIVGDGVAAWHTDTLKMRYEYVEGPDMSQLWLALTCNRFKVPQMVVEHPENYLKYLWPEDLETHKTLWEKYVEEGYEQTDLINTRWK